MFEPNLYPRFYSLSLYLLKRARIRRVVALLAASAFLWTFVLATPAQAAVRPVWALSVASRRAPKPLGYRVLSDAEQERIVGGLHMVAVSDQFPGFLHSLGKVLYFGFRSVDVDSR